MPQSKVGIVTGNKMANTVVVKVSSKVKHPLYKKLTTRSTKFKARTESELNVGDKVKIIETRPTSKDIHFKVVEVIK